MNKTKNGKYAAFLTFAFLYSGAVVGSPFYQSGNPVASCVMAYTLLALYSILVFCYFERQSHMKSGVISKSVAVLIFAFGIVSISDTALKYVDSFGSFAEYYSSPLVAYSALLGLVFCGVYGAYKGRMCVSGFARIICLLFVVWTVAGFLAFVHTKTFVPMESPLKRLSRLNVWESIKDAVEPCADVTILAAVLTDNRQREDRQMNCKWAWKGVLVFVLLGLVNLLKNLFLFGERLASDIDNPDLAAIRLIPMFELPEVSVLINTLAAVLRISVYGCGMMFVLKDAFDEKYKSNISFVVMLASICALCTGLILLGEKEVQDGFTLVAGAVLAMSLLAFFSCPEKK